METVETKESAIVINPKAMAKETYFHLHRLILNYMSNGYLSYMDRMMFNDLSKQLLHYFQDPLPTDNKESPVAAN